MFGPERAKIAMLGLDAAGKTTILYKLKIDETVTTIPTVGFNVEEVNFHNLTMTVWDVGGQKIIRYHLFLNFIPLIANSSTSQLVALTLGRFLKCIMFKTQVFGIDLGKTLTKSNTN